MSRVTTYAYDLSGNLVTKAMPNGVAEQRSHDARNRVGALNNVPVGGGSSYLSAYGYGYDAAGNVMQVAETYPGGSLANRTITNTYDGVYRLVQEEIVTTGAVTVATSYTYDKGNNRISKGVTGGGDDFGGTTYVIGNGSNGAGANQIKSATLPDATVVGFTYDANGNRTQRTEGGNTDTYSYDYENRLVGLDYETGESGTGTYGYSYDYRTRRVSRTEPGPATTQIVFNGGTSIEEYSTGGPSSPVVEYVRGHDYGGGVGGLEYSVRSSTASFNQYDSRGDVTGQTDASGTVTYQAAYKAFGKHPVESGSTQDRQKANTKEEDPTGLLNEGFRYRDLETGTFITRDPIGFKGGPNMYTYVRQNPWTQFDPEGLDPQPNNPQKKPNILQRTLATIGHALTWSLWKHGNIEPDDPIRTAMAQHIVDSEARRDANGLLRVYKLPANDGGGSYEVAGINQKYDTKEAAHLKSMIEAKKAPAAEKEARDYIANQTDPVAKWTSNRGVEFFLRDSYFNRGAGGAAKILQIAVGVKADGGVGTQTKAAEVVAEKNPHQLLQSLRQAREDYENIVAPGRDNLRAGLVSRWNDALRYSESLEHH